MPDIASISAIISSIKAATDIAKLLRETDLSLEKAELRLKLADLIGALADAKIEAAAVQETLNLKDSEIRELKQTLNRQKNVKYEDPAYWAVEDGKRDGPFCQRCYDDGRKLIRLQVDAGIFQCKACDTTYTTKAFRDAQEASVRRINNGWEPE